MSRLYTFGTTVTKNEFAAIRGKRHRTIVYLVMILVFTFLCIGFANKALEYQKKLAVNPFSNWINIEVTRNVQDSSMNLLQALSEPALRDRFLIRNIYLSKGFGASFLDCNGIPSGLPLPKARTIDPGSPVIADLLDSPLECNTIDRRNVFREEPFGFVVTNGFLEKLGFHGDSVKYLSYGLCGDDYIPVHILGVVRDLPDHADALCTDSFYIMKSFSYQEDPFFSKLFIETTDPGRVEEFKSGLQQDFNLTADTTVTDAKRGLAVLSFSKNLPATRQLFSHHLSILYQSAGLRKFHFGPFFDVAPDTSAEMIENYVKKKRNFNFDYLAVEFSRLDKLQEFSGFIRKRYNVSMNMETVEQRQNFLFSLNISLGAILLLLIISGLSILIFLSNSLKNHLDKVKRNLGNFMAFGASRGMIIGIYTAVIFKILLISILIAFAVACAAGELFDHFILKRMLILGSGQDYFSLFNTWLPVFICIVIVVALLKTAVSVRNLLKKSPGDLIYERENNASAGYSPVNTYPDPL